VEKQLRIINYECGGIFLINSNPGQRTGVTDMEARLPEAQVAGVDFHGDGVCCGLGLLPSISVGIQGFFLTKQVV